MLRATCGWMACTNKGETSRCLKHPRKVHDPSQHTRQGPTTHQTSTPCSAPRMCSLLSARQGLERPRTSTKPMRHTAKLSHPPEKCRTRAICQTSRANCEVPDKMPPISTAAKKTPPQRDCPAARLARSRRGARHQPTAALSVARAPRRRAHTCWWAGQSTRWHAGEQYSVSRYGGPRHPLHANSLPAEPSARRSRPHQAHLGTPTPGASPPGPPRCRPRGSRHPAPPTGAPACPACTRAPRS